MTSRDLDSDESAAVMEAQLMECRERERVHELEIAALRRELEIRLAYNATLEQDAAERQHHTDWLYSHIEHVTSVFEAERHRSNEVLQGERSRLAKELAAERRRTEEAVRALQRVTQDLEAERKRISYILVQRMASRVSKHRAFFAWLGRAARGTVRP